MEEYKLCNRYEFVSMDFINGTDKARASQRCATDKEKEEGTQRHLGWLLIIIGRFYCGFESK